MLCDVFIPQMKYFLTLKNTRRDCRFYCFFALKRVARATGLVIQVNSIGVLLGSRRKQEEGNHRCC